MTAEPRHHFVEAGGLHQHLLEWGRGGPPVLLLHGFLEHARVWDWVAPLLAAAGLRVLALDWRGHGDSEWIGRGGYYHFADYVADLRALVRWAGGRAALVAHSMGASAALLYAGTDPERVTALACIDSLGPPDTDPAEAPARYRAWLDDLARAAARAERTLTLEEAIARITERFPRFPAAVARHVALHGTRPAAGGRAWKFDPRHQTRSPQPYYVRQARAFWQAIRCPVLVVEGAESPVQALAPDTDERVRILRAERVVIADCGHHPHLEHAGTLAGHLLSFLRRHAVVPSPGRSATMPGT